MQRKKVTVRQQPHKTIVSTVRSKDKLVSRHNNVFWYCANQRWSSSWFWLIFCSALPALPGCHVRGNISCCSFRPSILITSVLYEVFRFPYFWQSFHRGHWNVSVTLLVSDLVTERLPSARQSEIRTILKTCSRHTGYGWEGREGGGGGGSPQCN